MLTLPPAEESNLLKPDETHGAKTDVIYETHLERSNFIGLNPFTQVSLDWFNPKYKSSTEKNKCLCLLSRIFANFEYEPLCEFIHTKTQEGLDSRSLPHLRNVSLSNTCRCLFHVIRYNSNTDSFLKSSKIENWN